MTKSDPHRSQLLSAFGDNLRRLRKEAGLTQEQLSKRAELHTRYLSRSERGEINISLVNLSKLARALGVTSADLLEGVDPEA